MTMQANWGGKVAIVTGGGGGIGLAAALEWARQGARVAIVDRDESVKSGALTLLEAIGGEVLFFAADVSRDAEVKAFVDETMRRFGRIDALFNNAGIEGEVAPLTTYSEEAFDHVWSVNVKGVFLGMKHVLPHLMAQRSGAIVNMSSVAGLVGAPNMAAYSAAKHAVIGLTQTAAGEAGPYGVRVNAICPGPVRTRMMDSIASLTSPDAPTEVERRNLARNPLRRYGESEEIAKVVVFLASEAASYVNGAVWTADGGRTAI